MKNKGMEMENLKLFSANKSLENDIQAEISNLIARVPKGL